MECPRDSLFWTEQSAGAKFCRTCGTGKAVLEGERGSE